jgi:glutamate carboxypeptidase
MTTQRMISEYIQAHEAELFELLRQMVRIQSGSFNKPGVDAVGRLIASVFEKSSVTCKTIPQADRGDHLVVRSMVKPFADRQVLLVGHMDTVFPADTDFTEYREDHVNAYGPGVADMKGGLVAGIYALKALDAAGLLTEIPITFVFNSDEEIGSGTSRQLIGAEARKSAFACVLEAGGVNNEIVTGRKGNISLRIEIIGKAGHAAFAGLSKSSAIAEMAHKILELEALNALDRGISCNVGQIAGGIGPNTVPESAWARVDIRFVGKDDEWEIMERIRTLAGNQRTPGTRTTFQVVSRPAMPVNEANIKLFKAFEAVASQLGQRVMSEFRQGVSDANLIAAENIPVIDGLGPVGANDHSHDEYMIKESLPRRALLLAHALPACWRGYLEGRLT